MTFDTVHLLEGAVQVSLPVLSVLLSDCAPLRIWLWVCKMTAGCQVCRRCVDESCDFWRRLLYLPWAHLFDLMTNWGSHQPVSLPTYHMFSETAASVAWRFHLCMMNLTEIKCLCSDISTALGEMTTSPSVPAPPPPPCSVPTLTQSPIR